jgi:starch-binding outer membrane protein, SusD/RagB family
MNAFFKMITKKTIFMKKYKLLCLAVIMVFVFGCEKAFDEALNRADDSRETLEGVLGDLNKVRGMFAATYLGIPQDRSDIYFWTTFESLTDNAFEAQAQSMANWRMGLLSPSFAAVWANRSHPNPYMNSGISGPSSGHWGRYWGAIRHCNTFLSNLDKVTVPLDRFPQAERELMRDEVIILRAYYYVLLIGMYGPLPFFDQTPPIDWDGWETLTRPTYQDIANTIVAELQGVIDRGIVPMKRDPFNEDDKVRVPLGFAYGLISRVLLYNASPLNNPGGDVAKYEAAAAAAKRFLDLSAYSLVSFEDTKDMYIAPLSENLESREVIWRSRAPFRQVSNTHGMQLALADPPRSNFLNQKAGETPTQEIVDCYELKNGAMIIESYDATHANPTFTAEALAAGYDDVNDPYLNRDDRFYRDILFNGNYFGESYQMGPITVWTYVGAPGTGTNGIATSGDQRRTYTGYHYGKDRDPIHYGVGTTGDALSRVQVRSIWMRYAEIYLNYAEALCGAGRFNEACDALDMTRLRANQPSIREVPDFRAGDNGWLMKRIQNERRIELVLEDHRFFDIRRWDIISDQQHNTISGMLVEKNDDGSFTHTRYQMPHTWECHNEKYKVLPVPLTELVLMPNLQQPEAWQ